MAWQKSLILSALFVGDGASRTSVVMAPASRIHFFDHAVHGDSLNLIPGILSQQVVGVSFTAPGFKTSDLPAGDGLANLNLTSPNSGDAVHSTKVHRRTVGKGDVQKNGLGILQVGVLLQYAHRLAGKADHRIPCLQLLDGPRSGGRIHRGVFGNAGEIHFESGERQGNTDQPANQAATGETAVSSRSAGERKIDACFMLDVRLDKAR